MFIRSTLNAAMAATALIGLTAATYALNGGTVNANLGGAPSAAAMAVSAGWPKLVTPGILVGVWGYVIGTPVGIMVIEILNRSG